MSSLLLATASNVQAFQSLFNALDVSDHEKWAKSINREALEDEMGRFRVWCGNLGALQRGHSSLEYRLRDSPLLSSNTLKFLEELETNLKEALAIVSEARLPFEEQAKLEIADEEEDDDGFFSEDEEDEDDLENSMVSKTELGMRFGEIVDIIDNLYKLSVRIRTPTTRARSLRASCYKPKDAETGVDIMGAYAEYDMRHIKELLSHLQHSSNADEQNGDDFLVRRLSAAVTLRRRQFKYWKRHREKLGTSTILDETANPILPVVVRPEAPQRINTLEAQPDIPQVALTARTMSNKTGKTLLSGTEATHHHQSLDEIIDAKSVTSYAVTVKDIHGRGVDLPPPPKAANGEKDFECPYCYVICPARYGRGRPWRNHLLKDLEPYICTYPDCESSEQLFSKRREWIEHEASHRKAWRCPEHTTAVYRTRAGLEDHLRSNHMDSFPASQLTRIADVGETTTMDVRQRCPICHVSTDDDGMGDFQNHVANHLERIAAFSLPIAVENDSDGASSIASRGWSGTSQDLSDMSLPTEIPMEAEGQEKGANDEAMSNDSRTTALAEEVSSGHATLSTESLQQLPDMSQNRLEMTAAQVQTQNDLNEPPTDGDQYANLQDDDQTDEMPADIQNHLKQREEFRSYLLSLPGAESVRFYRRYGSWTGQATFRDNTAAAQAIITFGTERFPVVKLHQSLTSSNKLKFSASNLVETTQTPNYRPLRETEGDDEIHSDSSVSIEYDAERETEYKPPILTVSDIPDLRSLYRSRRLLQRDQSFNPNDNYNQMISLCYHDLTRLRVDAIINSANANLKASNTPMTLSYTIFKAAGPGLSKEARSKRKMKPGQVELTRGHNLPSSWIIHAARSRYSGSRGMGQFNVLTECYRSALKMAANYEFKTVAFPCLGAGGCGFPSRVAARIALQEVREYLDSHKEYQFERIIFCVNSAVDEKAYTDFFPVFFPPTHGDVEVASSTTDFSANRSALASQVLDSRAQVQKVLEDFPTDFGLSVKDFDSTILTELDAIDSALAAIRGFLLGPKELKRSLGDLNLFCSVIQTLCGDLTELVEQAMSPGISASGHQSIWNNFDTHMKNTHGTGFASLLVCCGNFIQHLADILTYDGVELDEMSKFRQRLEAFKAKYEGEAPKRDFHDHLEEILYTRTFQGETPSHHREVVKVYQISSVSRLYQLGELEAKPTLAHPSAIFNHAVCLIREDITKLEIDVLVNSTDSLFAGSGTLDRTVFKKGGPELQAQIKKFGKCNEGDVFMTLGYLLPAKHILHVIPPEQYGKNTKDVLRKIYREILHTAVLMRATSIAIPSIGTGMLNYPRRDSASLALEEVKHFLESAEPTSLLEKIIFVTFSSNDEFIYKSLLPVYFPPVYSNPDPIEPMGSLTIQSENQPVELMGDSPELEPSPTRRRTLFGSIGEAFRSVRFGKQPETSRQITSYEEYALIEFESHAKDCPTCKDISRLYLEGSDLCEKGYPLAQVVLWYMDMAPDRTIYTKPDHVGQRVRLEVPADLFPLSLTLLSHVDQSFRDQDRNRPFVSQNRPYLAVAQDQVQEKGQSGISKDKIEAMVPMSTQISGGREKPRAEVATYSFREERWDPIYHGECSIHIYPGRIDIRDTDYPTADQIPLLSLELTHLSKITQHATDTEILLSDAPRLESVLGFGGDILFRSRTAVGSEALLDMMQRAQNFISAPGSGSSVSNNNESQKIGNSYPDWNRRLHNIRDELASTEHNQRHANTPQNENQNLDEATSKLVSSPQEQSVHLSASRGLETGALKLPSAPSHEPSSPITSISSDLDYSPLAAEIYTHLEADLRSRPGSYIGKHIDDIGSALQRPTAEISAAIEELAVLRKVHNTIDGNTWVISNSPSTLPPIRQQQNPPGTPSTTGKTEQATSILAAQVLSYMKFGSLTPDNQRGHTVREIASALQRSTADIWPAIRELGTRGDIRRSLNAETWVVTTARRDYPPGPQGPAGKKRTNKTEQQEPDASVAEVRETPTFQDTPPSPIEQNRQILSNFPSSGTTMLSSNTDLSTVQADDFLSSPSSSGAHRTRVSKQLVDAQVLTEVGETFDETEDSLIVHRVLRRGEIERWEEKTKEVRDRKKLRTRRMSDHRRSEDRERGRREDEVKDNEQERLERVLAGDVKEDTRHFGDEDDERKVDEIR